jgi:hypothetical protein
MFFNAVAAGALPSLAEIQQRIAALDATGQEVAESQQRVLDQWAEEEEK